MIHQREDHLGLTLSLNFQTETHQPSPSSSPLHSTQTPSITSSSTRSHFNLLHNTSVTKQTSDRSLFETCRVETRSFLKGIDVNRLPAMTVDMEEEAGVSSPNSTISSSVSGKRRSLERSELGNSDDIIDCDDEDGDNSRKKLRLSKDQAAILEDSFKEHNTLNPKQKLALAKRLGLRPRQVEVWFQNRRARTKLKQTEVDCEFLKRCCENLTEENRRLQKEVQDLRALKSSPQFYMQMAPPTTLTMCPSCERVSAPTSSSVASPSTTPAQPRLSTSSHHRVPFNPWAIVPAAHQPLNAVHHRS